MAGRGFHSSLSSSSSSAGSHFSCRSSQTICADPIDKITTTPDFPYDEDTQQWLQHIKKAWPSWKKSKEVSVMIHNCFSSVPNPYYSALYMMYHSGDFNFVKTNSLSYTVIEELKAWLQHAGSKKIENCLTKNLRIKAFNVVTLQRSAALIRLVFSVYQLSDIKNLFMDDIKSFLNNKQYKEACYIITSLGLNDKYGIEDFIIPLVFQDKLAVVEECLLTSPCHQTELISYLDRLLGLHGTLDEVEKIAVRLNISDVRYEKFNYKPLSKLIARLIEKYHIPGSYCPNLDRKRKEGALQFLLTKKYVDNSIGGDSWREMVEEAVGSSVNLQKILVDTISVYGDYYEALHWARVFGLPYDNLPYKVKEIWNSENISSTAVSTNTGINSSENWDDEDKQDEFHTFPLPISSIHVIDTEERLQWMIDDQLPGISVIGFDAEWKPVFGTAKTNLALLQIATMDNVYILDLMALNKTSNSWLRLGESVFGNELIMKIGFGIECDVSMMKQSLSLGDINMSGRGYLDMRVLWKKLLNDWSIKFPYTDTTPNSNQTAESLSNLVFVCCGQKLNKHDQFSDWERRPLRDTQKVYAALDAYCLLEIYYVMQNCCNKQGIPFYEVCVETMASTGKKPVKNKSTKSGELLEMPPKPNPDKVPVSWLRVVCQTGLEGLGKQLRMCGVDAILLPHMSSHEECLKAARPDNRVIITKGSVYNKLYKNVPPGQCFRVKTNTPEKQLFEVLEYYNVAVKMEDIYSRCMVCNGDNFIKVESSVIKELIIANSEARNLPYRPYNLPRRDHIDDAMIDMENRFLSDEDEDDDDDIPGPPSNHSLYNPYQHDVVQVNTCQTVSGVHIKVEEIPIDVVNSVSLFHICNHCGKCYWDGMQGKGSLKGHVEEILRLFGENSAHN